MEKIYRRLGIIIIVMYVLMIVRTQLFIQLTKVFLFGAV